ncbi:MAG: tRNA 4-thiouridine(8) synthase ThiI [Proteobacteria bacterium]|nr:MAG: tRNA 4-thiouridine(8) synthase ThiI [Pseudomonadota bacterium]
MSEPAPRILLLRFSGEIATKAKPTRRRFEARLVRNVRDALRGAGVDAAVTRTRSRIFVASGDPRAADAVARVFGVQSLSVATVHPAEKLDDVVHAAYECFRDAVAGKRFAVRARRVGDRSRIGIEPRQIERALGARLLPHSAGVHLDAPEVVAGVELHEGNAYLCSDERRGPAGLPLGVEGGAVALLSGGYDSAVAAWQMMRRGVHLDYVFCNLGGRTHELGVLRVAQVLGARWSYGDRPHLHAVDFDAVAADIRAKAKTRWWQILLKRQMLRAAEALASERQAEAIVTGDAIGQVSSQTLSNLAVISQAATLPILRPLIGANKDDIIRLAEHVGTARVSAVVDEYCAMVPSHPATTSRADAIAAEEARLDASLLAQAIAARRVFDLRHLDPDAHGVPELEVDAIPDDATVIDLRSRTAFAGWHWPGALQLDFDRALAAYRSFAKDRRYVLYCEFGLKSAHLAERMRAEGFDASNFRGALRGVVALAKSRRLAAPEAIE